MLVLFRLLLLARILIIAARCSSSDFFWATYSTMIMTEAAQYVWYFYSSYLFWFQTLSMQICLNRAVIRAQIHVAIEKTVLSRNCTVLYCFVDGKSENSCMFASYCLWWMPHCMCCMAYHVQCLDSLSVNSVSWGLVDAFNASMAKQLHCCVKKNDSHWGTNASSCFYHFLQWTFIVQKIPLLRSEKWQVFWIRKSKNYSE